MKHLDFQIKAKVVKFKSYQHPVDMYYEKWAQPLYFIKKVSIFLINLHSGYVLDYSPEGLILP